MTQTLTGNGGQLFSLDNSELAGATIGGVTDIAVSGDVDGSVSAKLRQLNKLFTDVWDSSGHRLKVDGSAVTQPVSGTFWQTTQPVSGTFFQATQPVSIASTVTVDTELPAAAALADGVAANPTTPTVGVIGLLMNATTEDRQRAILNSLDSIGTGIAACGLVAQVDDTATGTVTENQFGPVRMSTRRALLVEGVSGGTGLTVAQGNTVSAANSTTTLLTASASFIGTSESALGYGSIAVNVFSNVIGTLIIEQSSDGTNWDLASDNIVTAINTGASYAVNVVANYFRVHYINGGTNQATFRLQTIKQTAPAAWPRAMTSTNYIPVSLKETSVTQPVSGTFWQATQPVSGTFWQTTQPVSGTFWQGTQPVSGTFWQATQPVSIAAAVTVDTELPAAVVLSDLVSSTTTAPVVIAASMLYDINSVLQRHRIVANGIDSTGTGVAACGILAQFDDTSTGTVTENQFSTLRMSSRRALLIEGVASGTAVKVDGSAVTQPISGTITSNQGGAPWTMDLTKGGGTTLTAAAALAEAIANPTALYTSAFGMRYNGASWDRETTNQDLSGLPSQLRTATATFNYLCTTGRGIRVCINVSALAVTGTLNPLIQWTDPVSGTTVSLQATPALITAVGVYTYDVYPGVSKPAAGTGITQADDVHIGRVGRVAILAGNTANITYSAGYTILL